MELQRWQELYARAERAARAFFAEHVGDVCARCFQASEERHEPSLNCCRRTNFVPDLISDPLLGGLAEESLGHTLLPLSGNHNLPGCAALGPDGCRIPLGRPDACNAYLCDHLYRCMASALPATTMCLIVDALEVFSTITGARLSGSPSCEACAGQVEELATLLADASQRLSGHCQAFAACKTQTVAEMLPPQPGDDRWPP